MSSHTLGLLIGGVVPALAFGLSNIFIKMSTDRGIGLPMYVIVAGLAVMTVGCVLLLFWRDTRIDLVSGGYAFLGSSCWAFGIFCVTVALQKYHAPVGVLTPLFNMNTLVAVLLALWVFAEWREVKVPQLLVGSLLIVVGGTLVARS